MKNTKSGTKNNSTFSRLIQTTIAELTDNLITAQAVTFFAAGFETSSTTMTHTLYELAQNISIQNKLRQEIQEEFKKTGGKLTYDSVKCMKYLHKVFQGNIVYKMPAILIKIVLVFTQKKKRDKKEKNGTNTNHLSSIIYLQLVNLLFNSYIKLFNQIDF